ncbi:MAG: ABC transporter permease [Actinomycetota bacterium]|nr:ABC transporter permease [Actinomycetota bacterium]
MSAWPSTLSLVRRQVRYQLLNLWRTPIALFFTIILPLTMLLVFNLLFGDESVETPDGSWPVRQFYAGSIAAFTAVSATFTNLANVIPIRREEGVLKRWRGTPLPPWAYVAGFIGSAILLAIIGAGLMLAIGVVAYDVEIDPAKVPAGVLTFVVGLATFAALGVALANVVPTASASAAAANAALLPLSFISDVFIPIENAPRWLEVLAGIFPLKPFVTSFQNMLNPLVDAPGFDLGNLAVVAVWGVLGGAFAVTRFRWEPNPLGRQTRAGRRSGSAPAGATTLSTQK